MSFAGYAFIDWDDTIAENIRYFREAEAEATRLIADLTGADPAEVARRGAELDVIVAHRMGLGQDSLETSWTQCYHEFCAAGGLAPDPGVEARLRRLCAWPYEARQELLPGAAETLEWLNSRGFEVTIWTAGDAEVQARKIRESGLSYLIHRQAIVPVKTAERLREFIGDRDPERCFVVGNSAHSDVRPALSLGVAVFHIDVQTWGYDHVEIDRQDRNYHPLPHIGALPQLLAERFRLVV